jgi:hypothetical protein
VDAVQKAEQQQQDPIFLDKNIPPTELEAQRRSVEPKI